MQSYKSPRILLYDIETSLMPVAVFSLTHNDYIHPDSILAERYIISASWQWEGEEKVHAVSVIDDPKRFDKNPHDDFYVVKILHDVMSKADVLVGHNSDQFDNKWVRTRILFHNLPPLPPISTLDTYKVGKKHFNFCSNKLDYIGKFLGLGKKATTSPGLWMRVLSGEKKAVREMVEYNKQDVVLLGKVFHKLQPYMDNHINRELFDGTGCPRCGSHKIQSRGVHRAITKVYQRYQCQACSGWFRELKADSKSTKLRIL